MGYKYYDGPREFRPLHAWSYVGYTILFAIPIVGWIFLIIFTFNSSNYNRRSFARSYWCWLFLAVLIVAALLITGVGGSLLMKYAPDAAQIISNFTPDKGLTAKPSERTATPRPRSTDAPKATQKAAATKGEKTSFQKSMDAYETFINEYVDFMNDYDASDTQQHGRYANLLGQYMEVMTALSEIDEGELSDEDLAYYLEVNARILRKLATIEE